MVTDQEIAQGVEELFRETNPTTFTSLNQVLLALQSKLGGFDLSHKLDFIRAHISLLFNAPPPATTLQHQHHFGAGFNPNLNVNVGVGQYRLFHNPNQQHHGMVGPGQSMGQGQGHGSYFPRGPTEISFAQPGSGSGSGGVSDALSSPTSAKDSTQSRPKRRGGPGGLNKLCGVSPQLETIVGQPAMPRTEIVKQLWAYIRKNNLQDPSNKRKIICNDELRLLFEVDCTDMFQMNKLLAKHIVPLDPTKNPEQQAKKAKVEESEAPSTEPAVTAPAPAPAPMPAPAPAPALTPAPAPAPAPAPTPAPTPTPTSPPTPTPASAPAPAPAPTPSAPAPILISDALAKFLGTSEKEMPQSEVYNRIEEYIKTEGLEDPLNSMVICDSKLQELLGCESIPTPGVRDALARNHLFPRA